MDPNIRFGNAQASSPEFGGDADSASCRIFSSPSPISLPRLGVDGSLHLTVAAVESFAISWATARERAFQSSFSRRLWSFGASSAEGSSSTPPSAAALASSHLRTFSWSLKYTI